MARMKQSSCLLIGFMWAAACCAHGDILTDWERRFHATGRSETFLSTAVDAAGNVYAAGRSFNGSNEDGVLVKYGPGGGQHWAIYFTGPGDQTVSKVAVTPDGANLFIAYDPAPSQASVAKLNPANGSILWQKTEVVDLSKEAHSVSLLIDTAVTPRIHWAFEFFQENVTSGIVNDTYSFAGTVIDSFGTGAPSVTHRFADSALRPGGGCYYLFAEKDLASNSLIYRVSVAGGSVSVFGIGTSTALAVSPTALFSVGKSGTNKIKITRYNLDTDGVSGSTEDTFTGATQIRVNSATASASTLSFGGSETVAGLGTEWLLATYNANLVRLWRTPRPGTVNNEFFRSVVLDPFGNLAALAVRAGNTDQIFTHVYDAASGVKIGQSFNSAPSGATNLFGLSVNSEGVFATGGTIQDGVDVKGLVWKTSQNGLKRLTTTQGSFTGGTVVPISVQMYAATAANRTVTLSSNSTFAPVPANVSVLANTTSKGFSSATLATTISRTVTITGTWQGVAKTVTFFLLP